MNADVLIVKVNPGSKTLGALNPSSIAGTFRTTILKEGYNEADTKIRRALRAVFGPTAIAQGPSRILLIGRMLTGIFMVLSGFILGSQLGYAYCDTAIFAVLAGALLIPGIATRPVMSIAAAWFAIAAFGLDLPSTIPGVELILSALSLVLAIAGPGRFSADAMLRRNLFRYLRRRERRQLEENSLHTKHITTPTDLPTEFEV